MLESLFFSIVAQRCRGVEKFIDRSKIQRIFVTIQIETDVCTIMYNIFVGTRYSWNIADKQSSRLLIHIIEGHCPRYTNPLSLDNEHNSFDINVNTSRNNITKIEFHRPR